MASKIYMGGFYTSRSFQQYQEHQIWSPNKEVMQVAIHEVVCHGEPRQTRIEFV